MNTSLKSPVSMWPVMTPSVVDGDAAALLAAVLQRIERVMRYIDDVSAVVAHVDAEYAALLVQLAENICSHCSLQRVL